MKKTCNGCRALRYEVDNRYVQCCSLRYNMDWKKIVPLEECPKPTTIGMLISAERKYLTKVIK